MVWIWMIQQQQVLIRLKGQGNRALAGVEGIFFCSHRTRWKPVFKGFDILRVLQYRHNDDST